MTTIKRNKRLQVKKEPSQEVEYQIQGEGMKRVKIATINYQDEYLKRLQALQVIAICCVMSIISIFPLQFLIQGVQPYRAYYTTSIGFIVAGIVPSIIAIFNVIKGRKMALSISIAIYGIWILTLSWFFWEIILFISILLVYFEVTSKIIMVSSMLDNDIKPIGKEGAYYHAATFLHQYLRFVAKFTGLLIGISLIAGILGQYLITRVQGDILFAIFIIIALVLIVILSRETITLDLQARLIQEEKKRREELLEKTHSKYS